MCHIWPNSTSRTHARRWAHTHIRNLWEFKLVWFGVWHTHLCAWGLDVIKRFHRCYHILYKEGGKACVSTSSLLIRRWRPRKVCDAAKGYTDEVQSWHLNLIFLWDVLDSYWIEAQFLSLENERVGCSSRQYFWNVNVSTDPLGCVLEKLQSRISRFG